MDMDSFSLVDEDTRMYLFLIRYDVLGEHPTTS